MRVCLWLEMDALGLDEMRSITAVLLCAVNAGFCCFDGARECTIAVVQCSREKPTSAVGFTHRDHLSYYERFLVCVVVLM